MRAAKWKGEAKEWWLRSYFALNGMGCIGTEGQMISDDSAARKPVRPAFNLDGSDILFLSNAKGGKADTETDPDLAAIPKHGSGEWKLTIYDRTRTDFSAKTMGDTDVAAGTDIRISYSGAKKGSNEYVSAIIADEQGQNLYYGRIAADSESGEAAVAVPYSLPVGKYTLKVYSEQYNGDYRTDHASNFVELPISVTGPDETGPLARIESVRRISTTEAEVTFKSNEPGKYSYTLVESGKGFESTFGGGNGIIPNRKEQTIIVGGLRPRQGCDIYFSVFDQSDNQYPQKVMAQVPADVIHEVTLHAGNGAVIAEGKDITQYAEGENVTLPTAEDMSRSGSVFKGWYADCDFSGVPVTQISDTDTGDKVFYAKWEWDSKEQFDLSQGTTYYFDLSGAEIPGTVNEGNSVGAVSVPDKSLHYVPFTYVGTIDAYGFSSGMKTTDESAVGNQYIHSLFVSDYNVVHYTGWSDLNKAGLIFGKSYTSGSISYTMRTLSGGNRYTNGGTEAIGPRNNEWDTILDKNEEYIKNADMFSWVQDEYENEKDKILTWRMLRGYGINGYTVRTAGSSFEGSPQEHYGFRPVLELPGVDALGTDELKPVTLKLNGGSLNGSTENIQIVVKKGEAFTAPASEGLVGETGLLSKWIGSDGKSYQPGDSVPAEVTSLTAQWGRLSGEIKIGTHKWNKLLTDVNFDLFFKDGESVEITAADESGGNVLIAYLVSDEKIAESELKTKLFILYKDEWHIGEYPLYRDGRYIIYARLSDTSGNVRYMSSDGIVVDNTAPVISGITDGKTYCEAQIVSVEEANLDSVTVNGNPVTLTDGKFTLNAADGAQTIVVIDKAGNTVSVTVTVNDGHTPLADDNDCTTPVLCTYCGNVAIAAKQHDFTGALKGDETGHWHQCQNDGCTVCDTKASHTGNPEWETTETQHTKKYLCCGYVAVETALHRWENGVCTECGYVCAHTGGEATCTEKAVCEVCGQAYGVFAPDNHTGKLEWEKTETQHMQKYSCCGAVTVSAEAHEWKDGVCEKCEYVCTHTGGSATCTEKAVCEVCGQAYGTVAPDNHTGNPEWEKTQTQHTQKYSCCGAVTVETEAHVWKDGVCTECGYVCKHSGGEATCTELAECEYCHQSYGDKNPANHSGKEEWVKTATEHTKKWMCCGTVTVETEAHTWKGNVCEKCGYKRSSSSSGGSYNPVQKPEIIIEGGRADLENNGPTLIITPDEGMTISKVTLNGQETTVTDNKMTGLKTGDKVEIICAKTAPTKDELEKTFKDKLFNLKITVRTTKTMKKNIKVTVKDNEKLNNLVKDIEEAGYTVKYKFYKSTKKASKYSAALEKVNRTYINTRGRKGTKYFYKAKIMVYDRNNKLIASSQLKQCKYGTRLWTK